jgi:hypothetical protein
LEIECHIPLELYYFNTKLNFYEPLVERTALDVHFSSLQDKNQHILILRNQSTLNLNFSVALYETLFLLANSFKEEQSQYHKNSQK